MKKKALLKNKEIEQLQIQLSEEKLEKEQLVKANALLSGVEQSLNEERQKRVNCFFSEFIPSCSFCLIVLSRENIKVQLEDQLKCIQGEIETELKSIQTVLDQQNQELKQKIEEGREKEASRAEEMAKATKELRELVELREKEKIQFNIISEEKERAIKNMKELEEKVKVVEELEKVTSALKAEVTETDKLMQTLRTEIVNEKKERISAQENVQQLKDELKEKDACLGKYQEEVLEVMNSYLNLPERTIIVDCA